MKQNTYVLLMVVLIHTGIVLCVSDEFLLKELQDLKETVQRQEEMLQEQGKLIQQLNAQVELHLLIS